MSEDDQTKTKQKINMLKSLNKRFDLINSRYWKTASIASLAYKISSRSVKIR